MSEFQTVPITDKDGQTYLLVVEAQNPGPYEQIFINTGGYQELAYLLRRLLSSPGTLIDLGANIGTMCLPVAADGNNVVAVELLPRNVAKLSLAAEVNGFMNIRVVEAAVTNSDGPVGFEGAEAWGQVIPLADGPQASGLRLDTIIDRITAEVPGFIRAPVVMKIDVEGHELAALQGAERFLRDYRPPFIVEFIDPANKPKGVAYEAKKFVLGLGYCLYAIRAKTLSPYQLNEPQLGLVTDFLAIPNERPDILHGLVSHYEIRPLNFAEQIAWLTEMVNSEPAHRQHAAAVVRILEQLLQDEVRELLRIKMQLSIEAC